MVQDIFHLSSHSQKAVKTRLPQVSLPPLLNTVPADLVPSNTLFLCRTIFPEVGAGACVHSSCITYSALNWNGEGRGEEKKGFSSLKRDQHQLLYSQQCAGCCEKNILKQCECKCQLQSQVLLSGFLLGVHVLSWCFTRIQNMVWRQEVDPLPKQI